MISDAQMRATKKYEEKNYTKIMIRVRKDSGLMEEVKEYCQKYDISQNSAFVNALEYCIKHDINVKK